MRPKLASSHLPRRLVALAVLLAATLPMVPRPVAAGGVVGTGTAGSCTNAAFTAALAGGGTVTFNCGASPVTIVISAKTIAADTTVNGGSRVTLSGNSANRLFTVNAGVELRLEDIVLAGGNAGASNEGGAIYNNGGAVTLLRTTTLGNSARGGGTIRSVGGSVEITDSTLVSGVASTGNGGHISASAEASVTIDRSTVVQGIAQSSNGGALYSVDSAVTIVGSTIAGNIAHDGGALFQTDGDLDMTNSTLSGNQAVQNPGGVGGAYYNDGGTATFNQLTISANSAVDFGGGLYTAPSAPTELANSILSGNTLAGGNQDGADCGGPLTSRAYNLLGTTDGCTLGGDLTGNLLGQDPKLLPLTPNGGLTSTMPLDTGSPALNGGNPSASPPAGQLACAAFDQRGITRPQFDGRCDIGAFESRRHTVGTGLPSSCHATAYANAFADADLLRFFCGAEHTLVVGEQVVTHTVVLDRGNGEVTLSGNGANRLFNVTNTGHLIVREMELNSGASSGDGGLIFNDGRLTVSDSGLRDSTAQRGGAIANDGTALIERSRVSSNNSQRGGGIIQLGGTLTLRATNVNSNDVTVNGSGGGIHVAGGTLNMLDSMLYGNRIEGGYGGGLAIDAGTVKLHNSGVGSNGTGVLPQPGRGGGIAINGGTLELRNVTIHANRAGGSGAIGGGLAVGAAGTVTLANSVLSGNDVGGVPDDCRAPAANPLVSHGYNLIEITANCAISGDTTGHLTGDPGSFGFVFTDRHPIIARPVPGNAVLDAGNPAAPGSGDWTCLPADARGLDRTHDARCDIGQVERDQQAPSGQHFITPPPNAAGWWRHDVRLSFSGFEESDGSGFQSMNVRYSGALSTFDAYAEPFAQRVLATEGLTQVSQTVRDHDGNEWTAPTFTIKLDKTAPTTTAPRPFLGLRRLDTANVPVELRWNGSDPDPGTRTGADPSGINNYNVQHSVNGAAFANITLPAPTATTAVRQLAPGSTYQYQSRAVDVAGNSGGFTTATAFTVTVLSEEDDRIDYSGDWESRGRAYAYGGRVRHSRTADARVSVTFTGTHIAWVSTRGPDRGKVVVQLDSQQPVELDLYNASLQGRRIVFAANHLPAGQHTLTITVLDLPNPNATDALVDVDAFVVLS